MVSTLVTASGRCFSISLLRPLCVFGSKHQPRFTTGVGRFSSWVLGIFPILRGISPDQELTNRGALRKGSSLHKMPSCLTFDADHDRIRTLLRRVTSRLVTSQNVIHSALCV